MLKRKLQKWLGIQELSDKVALLRKHLEGTPIYPSDDPHEPEIVKGYGHK